MRAGLRGVEEGLRSCRGVVLRGGPGLRRPPLWRQSLAQIGAYLDQRPGRTWRPLLDTAVGAQLLTGTPAEWLEWRRGNDYYNEAVLIWLEADVTIRQLTHGERSLDDFCRKFHGGESGDPKIVPYTLDEVVETLNAVAPNDWRAFFDQRLNSTGRSPLGGITGGGWRVAFGDTVPEYYAAQEKARKNLDERFSVGLMLGEAGAI